MTHYLRALMARLRGLFANRRADLELDEEIEAHLRLLTERYVRQGMTEADATRTARCQFGNVTLLQEAHREMRGIRFIETLFQDVRYGLWMLRRNPGFTFVAVLTLSLGIGANTAIFSIVNAVLLKPLPYPNPDRLVWLAEFYSQPTVVRVSVPHFFAWKEQSQTLAEITAYQPDNLTLTGAGEPERLDANRVSAQFFTLLGVKLEGRNFLPAEDQPGGVPAAIISHSLWQRRFSADRQIIGRSITLNNQGYTVVGVLPPDFRFIHPFEVWIPLALDPAGDPQRFVPNTIAGLKPGVTPGQALAELETISRSMESGKTAGQPHFDGQVQVVSLREKLVGETGRLLLILLGAVSLILLIALANVANLLLSRAAERQKEFAVRAALGARPWRLMQQILIESWLLALGGSLLGLLLAVWLNKTLVALAAAETFGAMAHLATIRLDFHVLVFTLLMSFLTGTLFGLAPAWQCSGWRLSDMNASLKEGGRGHRFQRPRLRHLLMVTEVALALVLLAGAGLLIRSFVKLLEVNPGYRPDNLLTLRVTLPLWRYGEDDRRKLFFQETLERVAPLPGVESVAIINHLPLNEIQLGGWLRIPGNPEFLHLDQPATPIGVVSEDYFRAMGIPLLAGRVFNAQDTAEAPQVVILSEALAQQLFPNEDVVGKQVWMPGLDKKLSTVIGVVGDVRHQGLDRDVTPQIYLPHQQFALWSANLVIHTKDDLLQLTAAVRNRILTIDREVPIYDVQTMEHRLSSSISSRRFNLLLLSGFSLLALTLAAVGVYGVIAYIVTQRTHEIGIRMALGATVGDVLRMVIWRGVSLTLIGVAIGLAAALALTSVMKNLLFEVSATDPPTFALIALLLIVVALIASYVPARRATKVDPLQALRQE